MKKILLCAISYLPLLYCHAQNSTEIVRYNVQNARQGIAVAEDYIYVISNDSITKCDKNNGKITVSYHNPILKHLNSGVVKDGKLYCAHSNYPDLPMWGSIEIWDTETLEHVGSHSFGIAYGSCTWVLIHDGHFYVMFAHYGKEGRRQINRDVSWSQLVKFDEQWRQVQSWVLPPRLIERLNPYSLSGGVLTNDGKLICTHHHHKELYVLSFPKIGAELIWEETIPTSLCGQGISLDDYEDGVLWGICRKSREVVKIRVVTD